MSDGLLYVLFAAISLLSAAAAIVLTGRAQSVLARRFPDRRADLSIHGSMHGSIPPYSGVVPSPTRYAFREGRLVLPIGRDDPFLETGTSPEKALGQLTDRLGTLDAGLPSRIHDLVERGASFVNTGRIGADEILVIGYPDGDALVIQVESTAGVQAGQSSRFGLEKAISNLSRVYPHLQDVSDDLQWRETEALGVTWANPAYRDLARDLADDGAGTGDAPLRWPLPRIFASQLDPPPAEGTQRRCRITRPGDAAPGWYEVRAKYVTTGEAVFSARPIDQLVQGETALRDFVQTLSKTFATLSTGLAVFDRNRQLVMFNPALVAISTLEASYLTGRPTLTAFLDQLRERNRMPEPRDYKSWRAEISRLEKSAADDSYHELWTLPGGDSLRVTGHPHPDGAIAFMFEDISREMTLTRHMRGELDLWRAVLDSAGHALAIAGRDGRMIRVNAAYRTLFGLDDGPSAADVPETLEDAALRWEALFGPSMVWSEIRRFALHQVDRAESDLEIPDDTGGALEVRIVPIAGGATAIWFRPQALRLRPMDAPGQAIGDDPLASPLPAP